MNLLAILDYSHTYTFGTQTNGQVYIKLLNPATGQPANGNYIPVTYQQNIDGNIGTYTVNIPGQSKAIYSGKLGDTNPATPYFTSFSILSIGATPDPDPPVNVCDLQINFVNVDNDESAPGAHDAQITINAGSSNMPIEYSLDGITYELSPTFNGLSGGAKLVRARDANGCTATLPVLVKTVSSLMISDPSVTLPDGNISRWNAAFNPVVFTYQRKDFAVVAITEDTATGNVVVQVSASLVNPITGDAILAEGDKVYLFTNQYKGIFAVAAVNGISSVIIRTPFAGNASGYININQLRPYYKVLTEISYIDKATGTQRTITSTNRPDNAGLVKADLSHFLQSLLHATDESNYTLSNFRDDNLSASYTIRYAEEWDDNGSPKTSPYIAIAYNYYVLYAAKQLGEHYGGNLAAYVPFANLANGLEKAKWITDFAEPAYSNGYPFDIGFIYGDDLIGHDLYCEFTLLDINRVPLPGGSQTSYLLNDDGSWLLNTDGSKLVISRQSIGNIPVPDQLGLNRLLIDTVFADDVYFINITLKYDDGNTIHTLTETQTIRVDDAVDDNSVYLRWIGLSGSWNYYRFVFNQEVSLDVQNAVIIKNYVSDWEHQESIEEVVSKSAGQKVKVVAEDLSVADIKGLQSIKYSPKVQMLVNKNPVKWQTIVINTATYSEYETRNGQAPFSVTFNMPAINIQTQ